MYHIRLYNVDKNVKCVKIIVINFFLKFDSCMWQIQRYKIKNKGKIKKIKYHIVVCADTTIGIRASDFLFIFFQITDNPIRINLGKTW